jgi:carboxyl-terminal processing protease
MRRILARVGTIFAAFTALVVSAVFADQFGAGSLWRGFEPALAITGQPSRGNYDLTRLEAVNQTLKMIREKYVEPERVHPRRMLLSSLNQIQKEVAQVIVLPDDGRHVLVRVDTEERRFRIDNIQGPWDVSARLREVFAFLQKHLEGTEVDLREVEYAACNGMLETLDPHSVFLSPEAYGEMNVQTSGAFGGLGIVISIRDQLLTVINPMPDTPAGRAGLERLDRIMKIDNESTLNMPLDAAVQRLRGDPGTKVTIWVKRDGAWDGVRPFELSREQIKVKSVIAEKLDGGIGYVKLTAFQATTSSELDEALDQMRGEGNLKGLVIDLRDNPGGLLDQAARVSDKFITDGVLVSTVGGSEGRDEKRARGAGTEPPYPIVVIVDGRSASASEIVAGALKNQDRAIIVGSQTFGKGSVQLVFSDITAEKAALKLTIAQYLTPGDVSIQGVGITPDIELDPMTVDTLEMDLTVQTDDELRERDLSDSLSHERAKAAGKPAEVVRYQFTNLERMRVREGDISDDEFKLDFPVRFARDLAGKMAPGATRMEQLSSSEGFIEQVRADEVSKVSKELEDLGVDWSAAPKTATKPAREDFEVSVETDRANQTVTAGEPMKLKVTVKNKGTEPIYRLSATTESENAYFDQKELVFGKIDPGEARTASAPLGWCEIEGRELGSTKPLSEDAKRLCKIPMDALSRSDGLNVRFDSAQGVTPNPVEIRPTVVALERPLFKYAYQIADNREGNGDGRIQRGEKVSMYLTVKNVGKGRSYDTQANISNLSGDGLLLHAGRFDISNMNPGDVRRVVFSFDVAKDLRDNEAVFTLTVGDRDLREFASEKVKIPVEAKSPIESQEAIKKVVERGATLFRAAKVDGRGFGQIPAGTLVKVVGTSDGWDRVQLDENRFAFVNPTELSSAGGTPSLPVTFGDVYTHAPPELEVEAASLSTQTDTVALRGLAKDGERLLDVYVYVGARKLFYKSNRAGDDPLSMGFDFSVPLRPGVNFISVVARENPDTTTRRTIVVRRDGEDGSILKSPKNDDPVEAWLGQPR